MAGFGAARTEAARRAVLAHERLGPERVGPGSSGPGQRARLWVDGARVTLAGAAFANGVFISDNYHDHSDLHSFPTRRSSDLWSRAVGQSRRAAIPLWSRHHS